MPIPHEPAPNRHEHYAEPLGRAAYDIMSACQALSISKSHLYDLVAEGKIRIVKIGRRTVVPASEIIRIAESGA